MNMQRIRNGLAFVLVVACVLAACSAFAMEADYLVNSFRLVLRDGQDAKAQLYGGGGSDGPRDILIVPAQIVQDDLAYRTVLKCPTKGGGLWDVVGNSSVHTLLIGDGVEVWWLFGYNNPNLRAVCLPDDTNGEPTCSVENSMLDALPQENPDLVYYVVEGSSAHKCCEELNLPFAFRPAYQTAGLDISQSLQEDDPALQAYVSALIQGGAASAPATEALAIPPVSLSQLQSYANIYPFLYQSKWGYLDETGGVAVPAQFDYAGECKDGLCIVGNDSRYGILCANGELLVELQFTGIAQGYNGVFGADAGGKVAVLNIPKGVGTYVDADYIGDFYRGFCVIAKHNKSGLVDENGTVVLEPQFDIVNICQAGRVTVQNNNDGAYESAIYATDGSVLSPMQAGRIDSRDGSVIVRSRGNVVEGNLSAEAFYISGEVWSGDGVAIPFEASQGYRSTDGTYYSFDDATALGLQNGADGQWYQIDFCYAAANNQRVVVRTNGEVVSAVDIATLDRFENGVAVLQASDGVLFPMPPHAAFARSYYDSSARCENADGYLFLRFLAPSTNGFVQAEVFQKNGDVVHSGFAWRTVSNADSQEEWTVLMPSASESTAFIRGMSAFENGYACIYDENRQVGLINTDGEIVMAPTFDYILRYPSFVVGIQCAAFNGFAFDQLRDLLDEISIGIYDIPREKVLSGYSQVVFPQDFGTFEKNPIPEY